MILILKLGEPFGPQRYNTKGSDYVIFKSNVTIYSSVTVYDNNGYKLYDSLCASTNGWVATRLDISINTTSLIVNVVMNCSPLINPPEGPLWAYEIGCFQ